MAVCGQPPVWTPTIRSTRQHLAAREELGVLVGVDVVGDDREVDLGPEGAAERLDQGRLAGADRPGHAEGEDLARRPGVAGRAGPAHVVVGMVVVLVEGDAPAGGAVGGRRAGPAGPGAASRSEHPGIQSSLLIAEDLVEGATGAGGLGVAVGQVPRPGRGCRRGGRPGLAGRGCGRRGWRGRPRRSYPGPPGAGRRSARPRARRRPAPRAARRRPGGASRSAPRPAERRGTVPAPRQHQAQVAPRASSCSPISRLARRIDGGTIEASASRFRPSRSPGSRRGPPGRPRRRARPRAGPATSGASAGSTAPGSRGRGPGRGRSPPRAPTNACSR